MSAIRCEIGQPPRKASPRASAGLADSSKKLPVAYRAVNLTWDGLNLRLRASERLLAVIKSDPAHPSLYRVCALDYVSELLNLTRAKDAAVSFALAALNGEVPIKRASQTTGAVMSDQCSQCAAAGEFGYHDPDNGPMIWYCVEHRISKHYADKRRSEVPAAQDATVETNTKVVPTCTLEEHMHVIIKRWDALDRSVQKCTDARLSLALDLLALKQRIEVGEGGDQAAIDWWGWFGDNCRRSQSDAEKLLAIAQSSDPPAAIAHQRVLTAKRARAHRERQKALRYVTQPATSPERALVDAKPLVPARSTAEPKLSEAEERDLQLIFDAFERLSWHGRREAVRGISRMYREWH
jgi:hypothetical protein